MPSFILHFFLVLLVMGLKHITYYVQNSLFQENYVFVQIYRKTPKIPSINSKELALNFSLFNAISII